MASKTANGSGSIRKRKDGTWEGRYCVGVNPKTGKPLRKSIYGKTKGEVSSKLRELTVDRDKGDLFEPSKITTGQWFTMWENDYLGDVKYLTAKNYKAQIETHLRPLLGGIKLAQLTPVMIKSAYKKLQTSGKLVPVRDENGKTIRKKDGSAEMKNAPLAAKSIRNVHGVLTKCLKTAVEMGYLKKNPCDPLANHLPRVEKDEPRYLEEDERKRFLEEVKSDEFSYLFQIIFWLGLRESEAAGLTWDCVDFEKGTVTIRQQLIKRPKRDGGYELGSPKNGKTRVIVPASFVIDLFKKRKAEQAVQRLAAGEAWNGWKTTNEQKTSLVFTTALGDHLHPQTVYNHYKKIAARIGAEDTCVHSLRHTHVVIRMENDDNPKNIQEDVGHYSVAFTLDRYGHVSPKMQKESAAKMQAYFENFA